MAVLSLPRHDGAMNWERRIVRGLNGACALVDDVAYRPAVVHLTRRLPRWWDCQLAHLSMRLDDRWSTGYWSSPAAPAAPGPRCRACHRRAAWLVVGGSSGDYLLEEDEGNGHDSLSYLATHEVELCGWCRLDLDASIRTAADLDRELSRAGGASIGWRWRSSPPRPSI
jgi:hypothetical protein